MIHPNAEPFFYRGNSDTACLLLHGFTGSPADLRQLGKEINQQGYTVSGPLIPGHGTTPEELAATSWQDWYKAAEEEYQRLDLQYGRVFVIGFSMGGLLALKIAANYQVAGLISLSTALFLHEKDLSQLKEFKDEYLDKRRTQEEKERNLREGRYSYDKMPRKGILSLGELTEVVQTELGKIHCPTLLIQSKDDPIVDPESAALLKDQLGGINKTILWLENSGHLITLGPERGLVTKGILDFLANQRIAYDHHCFGCGEQNGIGLKLKFSREEDKICTDFVPTENHQGYPGIMHGGITSTILDELMSQCLNYMGLLGVTARLEIRYKNSIPINCPIKAEARILKRKGRLVDIEGRIWLDNGQLAAESLGRFMLIRGKK